MTTDDRDEALDPRIAAAEQVEKLAEANARSNKTMLTLVQKVSEDAFMRERKVELLEQGLRQTHKILVLVVVALAVTITMAFINFYNIQTARRNAEVTAEAARDAKGTYALLYGCFEPSSQCSKLNTAKQKQILDEIKKYELVAFYCIRTNPGTVDPDGKDFIACVNRLYPGGPQLPTKP